MLINFIVSSFLWRFVFCSKQGIDPKEIDIFAQQAQVAGPEDFSLYSWGR